MGFIASVQINDHKRQPKTCYAIEEKGATTTTYGLKGIN